MQKKYWDYQYHEGYKPWALCVIASYPRGHFEKAKFAFDVYSELIPNKFHVLRIKPQRYDDMTLAVNLLTDLLIAIGYASDLELAQNGKQISKFLDSIIRQGE